MLAHIALEALLVLASVNPSDHAYRAPEMTFAQKLRAFRRAEEQLNTCIIESVRDRAPAGMQTNSVEFTDLITTSFRFCVPQAGAMIEALDAVNGTGQGRTFFTGPYLDTVPAMVSRALKKSAGPLGAAE
jgi:hypothetical protein